MQDTGTGFEGTPEEALPYTIDAVSVVPMDLTKERLLGITVFWSDGIMTYGFCFPSDVELYLTEMVQAREAAYNCGKEVKNENKIREKPTGPSHKQ